MGHYRCGNYMVTPTAHKGHGALVNDGLVSYHLLCGLSCWDSGGELGLPSCWKGKGLGPSRQEAWFRRENILGHLSAGSNGGLGRRWLLGSPGTN